MATMVDDEEDDDPPATELLETLLATLFHPELRPAVMRSDQFHCSPARPRRRNGKRTAAMMPMRKTPCRITEWQNHARSPIATTTAMAVQPHVYTARSMPSNGTYDDPICSNSHRTSINAGAKCRARNG